LRPSRGGPEEHAVFDDIEFDDVLIAEMMANIAANGMSLEDLAHRLDG
jgi:hypothetical protein